MLNAFDRLMTLCVDFCNHHASYGNLWNLRLEKYAENTVHHFGIHAVVVCQNVLKNISIVTNFPSQLVFNRVNIDPDVQLNFNRMLYLVVFVMGYQIVQIYQMKQRARFVRRMHYTVAVDEHVFHGRLDAMEKSIVPMVPMKKIAVTFFCPFEKLPSF